MFGINYRYQLNEEKGTIKLRPTAGSLIASCVPFLVVTAGLMVLGSLDKPAEVVELEEKFDKNKK